jgi:hypothetical protein
MSDSPIFIVAAIGAFMVLAILLFGIGSFARGGEFNQKNANKIMRYRVMAQAAVVLVIVVMAWAGSD